MCAAFAPRAVKQWLSFTPNCRVPSFFLISQLKRTTLSFPSSNLNETFINFIPASSGATRSLPSFLSFSLFPRRKHSENFLLVWNKIFPFSRFEKKNLKKTTQFVGSTKQVLLRYKCERGEKVSAPRPEDIFSTLSGDGVSRRIAHAYILIRGCSCYKL